MVNIDNWNYNLLYNEKKINYIYIWVKNNHLKLNTNNVNQI